MTIRTTFMILGLLLLPATSAIAQGPEESESTGEERARAISWVPIEVSENPDAMNQKACVRRAQRPGYGWIAGRESAEGLWLQGHWQPERDRPGQVWVPGHPGPNGRWVLGFWRQSSLPAFVWIDGYWLSGVWHQGHWSPLDLRAGFVWVHGHVAGDTWRIGHWRARVRTGSIWVPAHWRRGVWMGGFWHVGPWVFGPGDLPVSYAQSPHEKSEFNRVAIQKVVRPRYVAYLLGAGGSEPEGADSEPDREARKREGDSPDQEARERSPEKNGEAARKKAKRDTKRAVKKKRRPTLRRRMLPMRRPATRSKPVSRRRAGQR